MSKSPPPSSQHSLEEFEEFERLIRENTAIDSDDDEEDSAASQAKIERSSNQLPADTGYVSVTDLTLQMHDTTSSDKNSSQVSKSIKDGGSVRSSRSSINKQNLPPEILSSDINDNESVKSATDGSCSTEQNHEDQNQSGLEDDGKMVATFGTTEAFEKLLQQQLEDEKKASSSASSEEEPTPVAEEKPASVTSSSNVQQTRTMRPVFRNRTARSPAANRARRANQKSKMWSSRPHQPVYPESSDDLSVHSDASRHELRRKLRTERVEREKEKSIKQQLQSEYDELLTKYARAENVIDQLRIGANIDIIAQLPEDTGFNMSVNPAEALHVNATSRSEPILDRYSSRRASRDAITDSSLNLPAAASREFARIALMHQAEELRNQMESFAALLDEGHHISDPEKRHVLDGIISNIHKLERDHMKAAKDHEASKQAAILTGNASGALLEDFDPELQIAGQIFQLNSLLEDLKEKVAVVSLPQTPVSSRRAITTDDGSDYSESVNNSNLDDRFNQQLKQYNKPVLVEEQSDTTVSSHFFSSDEDTTVEFPGKTVSHKDSTKPTSTNFPERLLRPLSSNSVSPPKITPRSNASSGGSSPPRSARSSGSPSKTNSSSQHSPEHADSYTKLKSRLPIPVASPSPNGRRSSPSRKKSPSSNEMDGDSGFVGSVSSRESMATKSPRTTSRKQELSPVLSVPPSDRSSASHSHRKLVLKPTVRPRSNSRHSGMSAATSAYTQDDAKNESDFFVPRKHAQTSIHTKREHKRKPPKSEDGSSAWSVPVRPAPPVPSHAKFLSGTSGSPAFSAVPFHNDSYRNTPVHGSEKSRPSSRRSTASKDSALDLIRGEIAKLRQELLEHQRAAEAESSRGRSSDRSKRKSYASDNQSTEVESPSVRERSSSRRGRSRRRQSRQGRRSVSRGSETDVTVIEKRDAKSGSDIPFNKQPDNAVNAREEHKGHWEYIPPYFSPAATSTQITSPRHVTVPTVVAAPLPQPAMVQFEPTFYSTVRYPSPARIYVPLPSYTSPKAARQDDAIVTTLVRRGSLRKSQVKTRTMDSSEENDRSLRRSHLRSPVKRSSSVPPLRQSILDPQLSLSLEKAERAADNLQRKSRSMYRSLRDSYNKAQLSLSYV